MPARSTRVFCVHEHVFFSMFLIALACYQRYIITLTKTTVLMSPRIILQNRLIHIAISLVDSSHAMAG